MSGLGFEVEAGFSSEDVRQACQRIADYLTKTPGSVMLDVEDLQLVAWVAFNATEKVEPSTYRGLAEQVLEVLYTQQQYFKHRRPSVLEQSKELERDLKRRCEAIVNPPAPRLF